jgi:hypothetical protein
VAVVQYTFTQTVHRTTQVEAGRLHGILFVIKWAVVVIIM